MVNDPVSVIAIVHTLGNLGLLLGAIPGAL
jgi:hypothetical protein